MRIRTRLLISYLVVLTIFTLGMFRIIDHLAIDKLTLAYKKLAQESINDLADANVRSSERILTGYGEEIVALHAELAALNLRDALAARGLSHTRDYARLRADTALRAIALREITVKGETVGYTTVFDTAGVSVLHPNRREVEGCNYRSYADTYPDMWKLVERSFTEPRVSGYYHFVDQQAGRTRDKYLVAVRVPGTPFVTDAVVSIDDYFAAMREEIRSAESAEALDIRNNAVTAGREATAMVKIVSISIAVALLVVCLLFAWRFAASIARPITALQDGVRAMALGNLDARVEESGFLETRELARAFNRLGGDLKEHIARLEAETAAREAIESEMRLAGEIQRTLLPPASSPAAKRPEYALFAGVKPALEVAGDFYDYFLADENTLVLAVGDVSGKGMPAAFLMSMTLTLLRSFGADERDPARTVRLVNDIIRKGNDSFMFVTLLFARYDIGRGELRFVNAGHHETLLRRADGTIESLRAGANPALGFAEVELFQTGSAWLRPGDTLLVFTDGITEAHDESHELYGMERFAAFAAAHRGLSPEEFYRATLDEVIAFQKNKLHDDITLLVLERKR